MGMKWYSKADGYSAAELICAAQDHMDSAGVLFVTSFVCFDSAGYLSHLSIELAAKAGLLERDGKFPNSHDLKDLFSLLKEACGLSLTDAEARVVEKLNEFGLLRYPEEITPEIGNEDFPDVEHTFWQLVLCIPELKDYLDERDPHRKSGRILMIKKKDEGGAESEPNGE